MDDIVSLLAADDFLDVAGVARHYALGPATVRGMIRRGALPAQRLGAGYLVHWHDVWAAEDGPRPDADTPDQVARYRKRLFSREMLARATRRGVRTVDRWLAAGLPTRNVGANVRVNPADAADWLNAHYRTQLYRSICHAE